MTAPIDTKNHPTVKALAAHQARLGLSGARFAKRYLHCSDATWSQLKSGTYPAASAGTWLEKFEGALQILQDEEANAKATGADSLVTISDQKAALNAVRRCSNEVRNRLVNYLADTGGGKTVLAGQISATFRESCLSFEATECWRDSYYAVLRCFAEKLELHDDVSTKLKAETAVIDALSVSPRVVVIDEAHYLGPAALNFIKAVLNIKAVKNRVVMVAMPQLWARMQSKSWEETRQLANRTFTTIRVEKIAAEDVRAYLEAKVPAFAALGKDEAKAVSTVCRAAANKFGLYNTLQAICDELNLEERKDALTVADAENAINRVEALRG